jgi:hypothetical protein
MNLRRITTDEVVAAFKATNMQACRNTFGSREHGAVCGIGALILNKYGFIPDCFDPMNEATDAGSKGVPLDFLQEYTYDYLLQFAHGFDNLEGDFKPIHDSDKMQAWNDGFATRLALEAENIPFVDARDWDGDDEL